MLKENCLHGFDNTHNSLLIDNVIIIKLVAQSHNSLVIHSAFCNTFTIRCSIRQCSKNPFGLMPLSFYYSMLHSAVEQKPFWSNALKLLLFDAQWSKAELSINRKKVAELSINREKVAELNI